MCWHMSTCANDTCLHRNRKIPPTFTPLRQGTSFVLFSHAGFSQVQYRWSGIPTGNRNFAHPNIIHVRTCQHVPGTCLYMSLAHMFFTFPGVRIFWKKYHAIIHLLESLGKRRLSAEYIWKRDKKITSDPVFWHMSTCAKHMCTSTVTLTCILQSIPTLRVVTTSLGVSLTDTYQRFPLTPPGRNKIIP